MIKRVFLLFAFLLSVHCLFSQRYDFDYYINYEMTFKDGTFISFQNAYNSKNLSYEMRFKFDKDGLLIAEIIDTNVAHYFILSNTEFPLKMSDFKYLHSHKFPKYKDKRKFKVTAVQDLGNHKKEYGVSVPLKDCKITVLPHDMNVLYSGLALTFDGVPQNMPLNLFKDEKLMVLSSKCKFKNGEELNLKLDSFQPINFSIFVLPTQLKFMQ